jgi:hypothetical protein
MTLPASVDEFQGTSKLCGIRIAPVTTEELA